MANVNSVNKQSKEYGIRFLFLVILILNSKIIFANIIINEIMYNPIDSEYYNEWIELYNNGSIINITSYSICSNRILPGYINSSDSQTYKDNGTILTENSYVIITDGGSGTDAYSNFNISQNAIAFHTDASSICGGLTNSGKTISLYNSNSILVNQINYTDIADEGFSIGFDNESWKPSSILGGTPGYKNSFGDETIPPEETENIILTTYLDEIIYMNIQYTKLFKIKIENKDNCSKKDIITISYNITNSNLIKQDEFTREIGCSGYASTGEFTPTMPGNYTLCGTVINSTINETYFSDNSACTDFTVVDTSTIPCNITINITSDKEIYTEGESIKFNNNLNNETFPFTIEYWIEDFFGNIYKNKYNTTNTNQKSWKTNIAEQDRVLFIKAIVYPVCNDSNLTDNSAEKMFIVKSDSSDTIQGNEESSLEITEVDEKVKFGEVVDVKVDIYKGNTNRYSIKLYVEANGKKVSEITKIHMYDKYSSYTGQLPIQLNPNCNLKLENGKYDVVLEGLGKEDEKEIKIEGIKTSLCGKSSTTTSSASSSSKKFDYSLIDYPKKISSSQEFDIKVEIQNNDDQDSEVDIWSYVYRGPKSYSGDRQQNKKHITIDADSSEIITLTNKVSGLEDGDYKLKVVINKDNQKTNKEIIEEISVSGSSFYSTKCPSVEYSPNFGNPIILAEYNIFNKLLCTDNIHYKQLIYESKNEKIKKIIPYFIITLTTLLSIILIFTKQSKPF